MSWARNYPQLKSKKDLIGIHCTLTGTEPNPLSKGLFEIFIFNNTENRQNVITGTRRDIQAMMDLYPADFTFMLDPKNSGWANVVKVE